MTACADKILVLGIDGMDPRLSKYYMDQGLMPNLKKLVEAGSAREGLEFLGQMPTITPPMWTTLSTGTYPMTHGITDFWHQDPNKLGVLNYGLDSSKCKAEQMWNVFAEAGKKTFVLHWPGSSWPPTSPSENLLVVDGTSSGSVAMSGASLDPEFILGASEKITTLATYSNAPASEAHKACVIEDLDVAAAGSNQDGIKTSDGTSGSDFFDGGVVLLSQPHQTTTAITEAPIDMIQSPIKPATGWAAAPADAKEFTILYSHGLIRRPALILKNNVKHIGWHSCFNNGDATFLGFYNKCRSFHHNIYYRTFFDLTGIRLYRSDVTK